MGKTGKVNFYLKSPKIKTGSSPINLHYYFNGHLFKFSTGLKVNPKKWNSESQRIIRSEGSDEANNALKRMGNELEAIHLRAISAGRVVNSEYLKSELLKFLNKDQQTNKGFFNYLDEYYNLKQGLLSPNYLKKVNSLKNSLLEFQRNTRYKITFESINLEFYDKFTKYLRGDRKKLIGEKVVTYHGMLNNSIGSNISILKTFLVWAMERGYNTNATFKDKKFKSFKGENDIIHLTQEELERLFEFDLSGDKRLEGVRDSFCFSCYTGLRYSDLSKVNRKNVKGDLIKLVTQKSSDKLEIVLNDFALEILERNDYKLTVISNQKTNDYLKELAKMAAINEPIMVTKFRGAERIEIERPKHDFISTHTGRRTFVTISLEKGMRAEVVMKTTGHKDYKSFKKYINITTGIIRMEMKQVWNRKPEMKVVS